MRLFCFPFAGAGASALQRWANAFPDDIEVLPIEYPGRWTRLGEPFAGSVAELADGVATALPPLLDRPYAVLGYSLGTLVAFEWMRRLERSSDPGPLVFFPCAQAAPHAMRHGPRIHDLPDRELIEAMEERYGRAPGPVLQDPELLAMVIPPLRSDLGIRAAYCYAANGKLRVPIRACGGDIDESATADEIAAWREEGTGDFEAWMYRGGHFFIGPSGDALRADVVREMRRRVDTAGAMRGS